MGFLQSLLGSPEPPDEPDSEPTMDLLEDSYTVAYPVAVRRDQLTAFQSVIDIERNTPPLDGPGADFILESIDTSNGLSTGVDDVDLLERTRRDSEELIQFWQDQLQDDPDVIFLPIGGLYRLRNMLFICETRDDLKENPFTLPDAFVDVLALVKRLQTAEDEKDVVIVHNDQLPPSFADR